MNQLKVGSEVFHVSHSDGKAVSEFYFLEHQGTVQRITKEHIHWGSGPYEESWLKPSRDGFTYFLAGLPNMESYKDGEYYKVPAQVLKQHMASYKSPWN